MKRQILAATCCALSVAGAAMAETSPREAYDSCIADAQARHDRMLDDCPPAQTSQPSSCRAKAGDWLTKQKARCLAEEATAIRRLEARQAEANQRAAQRSAQRP